MIMCLHLIQSKPGEPQLCRGSAVACWGITIYDASSCTVMPLSCGFLGRMALVVFRAGWTVAFPPATACSCFPKLLVQWGAECCLWGASSHSGGDGNKVPWKELGSISATLLQDSGPSPWHFLWKFIGFLCWSRYCWDLSPGGKK